jgi:hypothetical protein
MNIRTRGVQAEWSLVELLGMARIKVYPWTDAMVWLGECQYFIKRLFLVI